MLNDLSSFSATIEARFDAQWSFDPRTGRYRNEQGRFLSQKAVEALKKDHEALVKKERVIDAALNASESEIREFQSHKQQELNKLDTVVALKMHQVTLRCVLFILV